MSKEEKFRSCGYCQDCYLTTEETFLRHVHECEMKYINKVFGELDEK